MWVVAVHRLGLEVRVDLKLCVCLCVCMCVWVGTGVCRWVGYLSPEVKILQIVLKNHHDPRHCITIKKSMLVVSKI